MSERGVLTTLQYCEKCGVLLAPLEEWARVCILHMTDEQARAFTGKAISPTNNIEERNPHADR